jgi:uncharacterized sodium:solute symporter family permease YidK
MGIMGASGKTSNPLGGIGVLTGLVGAICSVILWIHYFNPDTTMLGQYSSQISYGALGDQLKLLAGVFGLLGVIFGIAGGLGGNGSSSTVTALLLGIAGLSFPALSYLNMIRGYAPNPV